MSCARPVASSTRLDNPHSEESVIKVTLRPLAPVTIDSNIGGTTIQGGVILELDVQRVQSSGRYEGSLTVQIDHL